MAIKHGDHILVTDEDGDQYVAVAEGTFTDGHVPILHRMGVSGFKVEIHIPVENTRKITPDTDPEWFM